MDDREAVRRAPAEAGVAMLAGPFLDFRDPWGNRIEIAGHADTHFTKVPHVLRARYFRVTMKSAAAATRAAETRNGTTKPPVRLASAPKVSGPRKTPP